MAIDKQTSNDVLVALTEPMYPKPREAVVRRYEAMLRELRFREDRQDEDLAFVREHGWNDKRLAILFALNMSTRKSLGHCRHPPEVAYQGSARPIRSPTVVADLTARTQCAVAGFELVER